MKHIVIAGTGRSGSNRMLDILDKHEDTLCRNEPNEVSGAHPLFVQLPRWAYDAPPPADFEDLWLAAVQEAAATQSERDRLKTEDKSYFTQAGRMALKVVGSRTLRKSFMGASASQWRMPGLWLKKGADILPVLKIIGVSEWMAATHAPLPGQTLIHVVRDPQSYLVSWWNRFILPRGVEKMYAVVREKSAPVIAAHNRSALPETFSMKAMLEGELWLWRSSHDRLYALKDSARYGLFRYEDTSVDAVTEAERAFRLAGLEFAENHRERILGMQNVLFPKPNAERLEDSVVRDAMEAVLHESPLGQTYLT